MAPYQVTSDIPQQSLSLSACLPPILPLENTAHLCSRTPPPQAPALNISTHTSFSPFFKPYDATLIFAKIESSKKKGEANMRIVYRVPLALGV